MWRGILVTILSFLLCALALIAIAKLG